MEVLVNNGENIQERPKALHKCRCRVALHIGSGSLPLVFIYVYIIYTEYFLQDVYYTVRWLVSKEVSETRLCDE